MGDITASRAIYIKIGRRKVSSRVLSWLGKPEPSPIHAVPQRGRIKGQIKISNTPKMRR